MLEYIGFMTCIVAIACAVCAVIYFVHEGFDLRVHVRRLEDRVSSLESKQTSKRK
jgi:hypothetical protein